MEITRREILNGVWLNHLHSDKFKTACASLTLLTQLDRETAAMNALLPPVLHRGTADYPDMEALSARLDELYGTAIEPTIRRIGEIQCPGFFASIPEDEFLPKGESVLQSAIELMCSMLISPNTRGGLLLPQYVDDEREKLLDLIRSRINDKIGYSVWRCIESMCCFEPYGINKLGSEEDVSNIRYKKLSKYYRELLQTSPIELFYCGRADADKVADIFRDALATLPRAEINYDIGTEVRMNSVEEQPRYVEEELDVSQGKLVMGFRLGDCMDEPDKAALNVFNAIFGSGTNSKLFVNVREKKSLCYFASSILDVHKGVAFVASGIDFDNFEVTRDEILAQLAAVARGEISDEELSSAKACVASDLRSALDSPGELEGFYLGQILDGLDFGPQELACLVEDVSKEDVAAIAAGVECDLIYFLKGSGESADEAEEE